jgi:hypothetical protein
MPTAALEEYRAPPQVLYELAQFLGQRHRLAQVAEDVPKRRSAGHPFLLLGRRPVGSGKALLCRRTHATWQWGVLSSRLPGFYASRKISQPACLKARLFPRTRPQVLDRAGTRRWSGGLPLAVGRGAERRASNPACSEGGLTAGEESPRAAGRGAAHHLRPASMGHLHRSGNGGISASMWKGRPRSPCGGHSAAQPVQT